MARESKMEKRRRVEAAIEGLRAAYPDAHCELEHENPLQLLIATVLSAQTSDRQVNSVTPALFRKYRSAAEFAAAPLGELEEDLKRIGLFRSKAKNIRACCQALVERHGGEVPRSLDELVALAGVGRKTANVVLSNAFGIDEGVVVDTHVARVSRRLGWTRETDPVRIERELQEWTPREDWGRLSHWLIWHGRRRCLARKPDCPRCEIAGVCPASAALGGESVAVSA